MQKAMEGAVTEVEAMAEVVEPLVHGTVEVTLVEVTEVAVENNKP
jgi:hypothetical protein